MENTYLNWKEFAKYYTGFVIGGLLLFIDFKWQLMIFLWFFAPVVYFLQAKFRSFMKKNKEKK